MRHPFSPSPRRVRRAGRLSVLLPALLSVGGLISLAACEKQTPANTSASGPATVPVPPASTPAPTTTTPPPSPAPTPSPQAGSSWIGDWSSSGCGPRKYVRTLTLTAEGAVSGEERISPCPPGVQCVWSGILPFSGTYQAKGEVLQLTVDLKGGQQGKTQIAFPAQLDWDPTAGALVERVGAERCVYERGHGSPAAGKQGAEAQGNPAGAK